MLVYKVARVKADRTFGSALTFFRPLVSPNGLRWLDTFDLDYVLGQSTVPIEGTVGILVFAFQEQAERFGRVEQPAMGDYVVLRCEAPRGAEPIFWLPQYIHPEAWTSSRNWVKQKTKDIVFLKPPIGSRVVPELIPLEVVFSTANQRGGVTQ